MTLDLGLSTLDFRTAPMPARKTFEFVLFLTCWFAFAWFNQGGGWNQNSRFGEVRAIVEEGRFAIDDFFSVFAR